MKKTFAVLMLVATLFLVGCGNQAKDTAKDAQQKVEQKAEEVKADANAKVDEVKDAANQAADEAAKKAEEVKADANAKVDEVKDAANQAADEAAKKAEEVKADADAKVDEVKDAANQAADEAAKKAEEVKADADAKVDEAKDAASQVADDAVEKLEDVTAEIAGRTIALSGVMPGASLEDLQDMFGEATKVEGDMMTFVDGLTIKLDNVTKKVKEISTTSADFDTPEGMYVGADEYLLNDYCGQADTVRKIDSGAEYEYNSGDKKSKVVYKAQNGVITEITCSLK